jgi:hypothetical protein
LPLWVNGSGRATDTGSRKVGDWVLENRVRYMYL